MSNSASIWPTVPKLLAKVTSLDQAPIPVFWVDQYGHIGYTNDQLCKLTGHDGDALTNQTLDQLIPSISPTVWEEEWWPILVKDNEIPELLSAVRHVNGMALEHHFSVTLLQVSGLSFAAFYLWSKVNTETVINNNSVTHLLGSLNECVGILDKSGKTH